MKKYSPYENCSCISYTDQRSRARSRTDPTVKTQGLCDPWSGQGVVQYHTPWSGGWALLRTFPTGSSTRLQCSTAPQTATESYEDTINHVPDKKSGRGGWERRGALAGFYGTISLFALTSPSKLGHAWLESGKAVLCR